MPTPDPPPPRRNLSDRIVYALCALAIWVAVVWEMFVS